MCLLYENVVSFHTFDYNCRLNNIVHYTAESSLKWGSTVKDFLFLILFPLLTGLAVPSGQQIRGMVLAITVDVPAKSLWLEIKQIQWVLGLLNMQGKRIPACHWKRKKIGK